MGNLLVSSASITLKSYGGGLFGSTPEAPGGSGTVTSSIVASRISGPAPLAVHFDAIGSTAGGVSDPWRELGYHFLFDDTGSGNWTHSGLSKNSQIGGPLAAHVFEAVGTYTVKVRAEDSEGNFNDTSVEITVTDPDTVYATTNTVCISTDGTFAGTPTGAEVLLNQSSWPSFSSNKRYLLKGGQDFKSFGELKMSGKTDWQVGKLGAGNDPIISLLNINGSGTSTTFADRGSVSDIEVDGDIKLDIFQKDILIFRCSWIDTLAIGSALTTTWDAASAGDKDKFFWPEHIFLVENFTDHTGSGSNNVFGLTSTSAYMGNEFTGSPQHGLRAALAYKTVVSHNFIHGLSNTTKHQIKMHSQGVRPFSRLLDDSLVSIQVDDDGPESRFNIIADNIIGEPSGGKDNNDWMIVPSPEANNTAQGTGDIIVENNILENLDTNPEQSVTALGGLRITERGNTAVNDNYKALTGTHMTETNTQHPGVWNGPYFLDAAQIIPSAPA